MSASSIVIDGVLTANGTLQLDTSPPLPPGRVRVTLQPLPAAQGEEELDWADLDYDPVPLRRAGQLRVRIEQRGKLKPMPHDLNDE